MARSKGKRHVGAVKPRRIRPKAKENRNHAASTTGASPAQNNARKSKPVLAGVIFAIVLALAAFCAESSGSGPPPSAAIQSDSPGRKEAFLQWFVDNGGTFHPIDVGDGRTTNVTVAEFAAYGGWGLALPVTPASSQPDECKSDSEEGNVQCLPRDDNPTPMIRHLDPLFTVPSSIITSVESIMERYAHQDNPLYLPTFYPDVNNVLTTYFPHGTGLARWGMGLPEQDAVIALYLMAEECQHRNPELFANEDSRWGPYLDVLPQYTVPRLDTFGDEEYAALQDEGLERTGRHSRRLMEQMYSRGANGASLQSVVREMIRKKMPSQSPAASILPSCLSFGAFHRFVAIVSSRAMVLRGTKHLTPLAEMINYAPKMEPKRNEGSQDWIRAPFYLYHALSDDGSITVRSDRDIFLPGELDREPSVQIFEDYGPVDSSLFLEAHGFVPHENPNNCATISGPFFLRRNVASGRHDENAGLVLRALKALRLIHPDVRSFEALEDVCVRADWSLVDDGNTVGRLPASDSIAIASLLVGDGDSLAWDRIEADHGETFASLKDKCAAAIHLGDTELTEIRCARYPGSKTVVKQALRTAAGRGISSFEANGDSEENLQLQLQKAEAEGRHQLALAFRFRSQERKILLQIANASDELVLGSENLDTQTTTTTESLGEKLDAFVSFVESLALPLNKIEPKMTGDGMRVGAFATEDLEVGDAYISLGADSVIDVSSSLAGLEDDSDLAALLKKHSSSDNGQNDGFDALLLYLLHERFVLGEQSRWWAYLALLPSIEEVREYHPLFIPEKEIDRHLAGSDVRRFVLRYHQRAADRHKMLASDLDANLVLGSDILLDRNKVLWATAIIDSRSIWWNGMRHLSPLLDLVNADSVGRAHATTVEDSEDGRQSVAVTRASRRVQKGEQLLENYAQPNHLLFTYHGFLLEDNPNDCALLAGLSIDRNDPGARLAHQLRSASPTFCIREEASLEELAHFLRVKNGLSRDSPSGSAIDDEVRPYVIQLLKERVARLNEAMDTATIDVATASPRVRFMRQIVQNDLAHFQHALAELKPAAA